MERAEYRFEIDALSPETLSLGRLVAYLTELSKLLGDDPGLHFERVAPGSAVLVAWAEENVKPKVDDRVTRVRLGDGPLDATKAFQRLNELLRDDNAVGTLKGEGGAEVIQFPGRTLPRVETIGPVQQPTTIEGQLIRIGGKDKSVPFHLADGNRLWSGNMTRSLAKQMSQHLFGPTLRVTGTGSWKRGIDGQWALERFQASGFEVLDDASLTEALARLRSIGPHDVAIWNLWRDMRGSDDAE